MKPFSSSHPSTSEAECSAPAFCLARLSFEWRFGSFLAAFCEGKTGFVAGCRRSREGGETGKRREACGTQKQAEARVFGRMPDRAWGNRGCDKEKGRWKSVLRLHGMPQRSRPCCVVGSRPLYFSGEASLPVIRTGPGTVSLAGSKLELERLGTFDPQNGLSVEIGRASGRERVL